MRDQSEVRRDLIQRLFAVAISVGFATSLIGMSWISEKRPPNAAEFSHLAILAVGMLATVLSWDGYLMSIEKKKLDQFWRFFIDVTLVFLYMFLLATSEYEIYWLPTLVIIFGLYFLWDMLTIRHFYSLYNPSAESTKTGSLAEIIMQYGRGIFGARGFDAGPAMTLEWGLYFTLLFVLRTEDFGTIAACVFAGLGLVAYRFDKVTKRSSGARGFSAITRIVLVILLLVGVLAWGRREALLVLTGLAS